MLLLLFIKLINKLADRFWGRGFTSITKRQRLRKKYETNVMKLQQSNEIVAIIVAYLKIRKKNVIECDRKKETIQKWKEKDNELDKVKFWWDKIVFLRGKMGKGRLEGSMRGWLIDWSILWLLIEPCCLLAVVIALVVVLLCCCCWCCCSLLFVVVACVVEHLLECTIL